MKTSHEVKKVNKSKADYIRRMKKICRVPKRAVIMLVLLKTKPGN
jgi:hypothetical protein